MDKHAAALAEIAATDAMRRAARQMLWARVRRAIAEGVEPDRIAESLRLSRATLYRRLAELDDQEDLP